MNRDEIIATQTRTLTKDEVIALQCLHRGEANEYQQRLALKVIVNDFSRAQDALYIPGSFDQTAFLNGRAFVGQRILKYINIPVGKLDESYAQPSVSERV
jgi:hypothetical protein